MARSTDPAAAPAVCAFCGRQEPGGLPLTWTTAVENGRPVAFCDTCSRQHLRAMEGKLDSADW
ncbi:MAG: hypothetical protein R2731_11875 [Nocardioides sp.]